MSEPGKSLLEKLSRPHPMLPTLGSIVRNPMRCSYAGLMTILLLCGCQSGAQLPPTPVIGATCLTLSGSCPLLTPPQAGGGCSCPGLGNGTVTGTSGP